MEKLHTLTEKDLNRLYHDEKKSLEDIARLFGVSRVAIFKKLKKFQIKPRSRSLAHLEAQKQGKVPQQYFQINEKFFSTWSLEMAYVLGLIITDGCITDQGTISLSMNDREVLEKVKLAMGSEHPIVLSKHQEGSYHFKFAREDIVNDLVKLGIGSRKSLTVKFPQVPDVFMADFIRGVFDGDGSVFFRKDNRKYPLVTSFCSGSKDFIIGIEIHLQKLGLPKRNIYEQKTKNGFFYNIKFSHKDSQKLFNILYKDYPNIPFLERKYNKFIEGFKRSAEYVECS
jgi:hypothetical protein